MLSGGGAALLLRVCCATLLIVLMTKNKTTKRYGLFIVAALMGGMFLSGGQVQAATISVSAGTDTKAVDGTCHLSEAIENINNQAQTNADCAAGTGNDVIQLPMGTITLSADLPVLTQTVTIQGQGTGKSVVDGAGQYAIFQINQASAKVIFKNLKTRAMSGFGIAVMDANGITVENVEADGTNSVARDDGAGSTIQGGFVYFGANASEPPEININGLYVHDYSSADAGLLLGVAVAGPQGKLQTLTGKNITVSNLSSTNPAGQLIAVFNTTGLGDGYASLNAKYENITIENITTPNALNAGGLTLSGVIGGGDSVGEVTVRNATIRNITTGPAAFGANGAVALVGGSIGSDDHFDGTLKLQNVLISNIKVDGTAKSCSKSDIGSLLGGQGTVSLDVVSLGGNVIEDNSCKDLLTHPTDKNDVAGLKDKLGALGNNGGNVPTIPLLVGSPAIDTGVCDEAPKKDARGVARPQGKGCDSGAYELVQAAAADAGGVTNPSTGTKVYIEPPIPGAIVKSASIMPATEAVNDKSFEYPLGIAGFTIEGVPDGTTHTMTLYFESDQQAEDFIVRKLNLEKNTFRTVDNAVLSNVTKNGKPAIKVSYQITDGGELDMDGAANGSITDPVGLAKKKNLLADTGTFTIFSSLASILLIVGVILVNIDYRKHKAPLIQLDKELNQNLASSYTFWHHVKVVTIPTLKYRFTIILEKKTTLS